MRLALRVYYRVRQYRATCAIAVRSPLCNALCNECHTLMHLPLPAIRVYDSASGGRRSVGLLVNFSQQRAADTGVTAAI